MTIRVLPQALTTVCEGGADIRNRPVPPPVLHQRRPLRLSRWCETAHAPARTLEREDGWRGFRIEGTLDFSLVGILSKLSGILAEAEIGIFAVSTYDTDYILVKAEKLNKAQRMRFQNAGVLASIA